MARSLTRSAVFVDTSAIIALNSPSDQFHDSAKQYFQSQSGVRWVVMNATTHESFTRVRYDTNLEKALRVYDWLRSSNFLNISFGRLDEDRARDILERYHDQTFSFHDALCAATMIRVGLYRIFSFDSHFWSMGFQVEPGVTKY